MKKIIFCLFVSGCLFNGNNSNSKNDIKPGKYINEDLPSCATGSAGETYSGRTELVFFEDGTVQQTSIDNQNCDGDTVVYVATWEIKMSGDERQLCFTPASDPSIEDCAYLVEVTSLFFTLKYEDDEIYVFRKE